MKITTNFNPLHKSAEKMGASLIEFTLKSVLPPVDPIDGKLEKGIEVTLDELKFHENGLLTYRGRQVLLYIKDHGWHISNALEDASKGKKFHLADCKTLDNMREKGKFERYVVKNSIDHSFLISGRNSFGLDIEGEAQLHVCKNCLTKLNYKNYNKKSYYKQNEAVADFSLKEFFDEYRTFFKSKPIRKESDRVGYTSNWKSVSSRCREEANWSCNSCNVSLESQKSLLHVHHINGVKNDNSKENLRVLCKICHANQPDHEHIKVTHEEKDRINKCKLALS